MIQSRVLKSLELERDANFPAPSGKEIQQHCSTLLTADIEITGRCNLACPICWGPIHTRRIETVSNDAWILTLQHLQENYGTRSVVISGGETLLREGIVELLAKIKKMGMRVTLSTNGTKLEKLRKALPYVDDLGLPLDGPDAESNQITRMPISKSLNQFALVVRAIGLATTQFPDVALSIRTIVSAKNYQVVPLIGRALVAEGIMPESIGRWKLYQASPAGPRGDIAINEGWLIGDVEFEHVVEEARRQNPTLAERIKAQPIADSLKRYVFFGPSGNVTVLVPDESGYPMHSCVGNVRELDEAIVNLARSGFLPTDTSHGA